MNAAPLLELFHELQRRHLTLGVAEYFAGLEALAAGFGTGSRTELCWMCQALWSKSPDDTDLIAEALEWVLPPKMTPAELEALSRQAQEELADRASPGSTASETVRSDLAGAAPAAGTAEAGSPRMELSSLAGASADSPLLPRAAAEYRRRSTPFDLTGELPVPRRYCKRAWRYVRRMQRVGPAVELDVAGTVDRFCREGALTAPVLVPRRRNLACVLVLVDEGGSMVPFRQMTAALIEAAHNSGFARVDLGYFHDTIGPTVFRDPGMRQAVPLTDALRPFAGSGILIVSDAGAARRLTDSFRVARTLEALAAMRPVTPRIAWLNPVPRERWPATTAALIEADANVQMFPFDRNGLDAAMDVLRGKGN